jgi:dienelactone hydrolase
MRWKYVVFGALFFLMGCTNGPPKGNSAPPSLYIPAETYEIEVHSFQDISYQDVLGYERSVNVSIYHPTDAPFPAPVVLLSHGGASGKTNPEVVLQDWAKRISSSGYVAVAIAHPQRDEESYEELCAFLGVDEDLQCALKINWERPHDVSRVLDWLEVQNESETLLGAMDLNRVAHLGHSAGAGCAMMLAGAPRNYTCAQPFGLEQGSIVECATDDLVSKRDDRVKAILAFSNQGPAQDGFMESSFGEIDGPVLIGTGAFDGDEGEPENRTKAFELLAPSEGETNRFMIFIDDPGAVHTLFSADLDSCAKISGEARCKEMRSWLYSAVLAFLDDALMQLPEAGLWLREGDSSTHINEDVSWSQK